MDSIMPKARALDTRYSKMRTTGSTPAGGNVDAVVGNGAPLNWCRAEGAALSCGPSADAVAGDAEKAATRCAPPSADTVAPTSATSRAQHLALCVQRLAYRVTALGGAEGLGKTWNPNVLEKRISFRAQRVTCEEDKTWQHIGLAGL